MAVKVLEIQVCHIILLSGPDRGAKATMSGEVFRIGKNPDNNLVLVHETVSRYHCEIVREASGFAIRDLGSTNGTLVDGQESKYSPLHAGAVVTVGSIEIKVMPTVEKTAVHVTEETQWGELVGGSSNLQEAFALAKQLARFDVPVVVIGPDGSGKASLTRTLHQQSPTRSGGPWVEVDCDTDDSERLAEVLLGQGSHGGMRKLSGSLSAFERAHGGTLLLRHLHALPPTLHEKLNDVIARGALPGAGTAPERRINVRVVATAAPEINRSMVGGMPAAPATLALLKRFVGGVIDIAPLSERPEDPLLLLAHAWGGAAPPPAWVIALVKRAAWPGDAEGLLGVLTSLRTVLTEDPDDVWSEAFDPKLPYRDLRTAAEDAFEKRFVTWLLARHHGNVSAAARAADMDRKYLHKLVKKHGIQIAR